MHSAPAVVFPVGRSRFELRLIGFAVISEVAVWLVWCWLVDQIGMGQVLAGMMVCAVSAWLLSARWRTPSGQLIWDGRAWALDMNGKAVTVRVEVIIDLQFVMLLRLVATGSHDVSWVWPEKISNPLRWHQLRCAVHNRQVDIMNFTAVLEEPPAGMLGPKL